MPRQRYQRGTLDTVVPANGKRPERKLPRGSYWARWYRYVRRADGQEKRSPREKIITKDLARKHRIALDYEGPLTKTDAQRVLDLLIAKDTGTYIPPDTAATFAQVAKEYLATVEPRWGPHTARTSRGLIEYSLIGGKLGERLIADITEIELQQFLNEHVSAGASKSKLSKILLYLRSIFDHAVLKKVIPANPARNPGYKLKAKSRKQRSDRYLSQPECQRLFSAVIGGDLLIFRIFIQLGLRAEELFALRRKDVEGEYLWIDEAIVEGKGAPVKSEASNDMVFVPPVLRAELETWLESVDASPDAWLFATPSGKPWGLQNYLNRVLKPAAVRARVGVFTRVNKSGEAVESTDVNFQVLRRTCGTLFGGIAKDPKSTQRQLRHADPGVTLRNYQQAIPENVKAAAIAYEQQLFCTGSASVEKSPVS